MIELANAERSESAPCQWVAPVWSIRTFNFSHISAFVRRHDNWRGITLISLCSHECTKHFQWCDFVFSLDFAINQGRLVSSTQTNRQRLLFYECPVKLNIELLKNAVWFCCLAFLLFILLFSYCHLPLTAFWFNAMTQTR